ncbi:MAG TPA: hypothetical protein VKD65_07475 [Candidatus Angelobacter sp.]|nr:hypothetical protein [Candidatus Angelobacter sp.]
MFAKNSRYFRLPESSPVNARGERLRGKDLRLIEPSPGTFLHTVQSRDRLDLLAVKYYQEPTRWWQISDANAAFAFPNDLLDRSPIHAETLAVVSVDMETRFNGLISDLTSLGQVRNPLMDFSESSVVVLSVTPPMRVQIINQIRARGLHYLHSFAWNDGMTAGELFRFEDRTAKQNWGLLTQDLKDLPGILELQSFAEDGVVRLVYNSAMIERARILKVIRLRSYDVNEQSSQSSERLGAQIVIPPNGVA